MNFAYPWFTVLPFLYMIARFLPRTQSGQPLFSSAAVIAPLPSTMRQRMRAPILVTLTTTSAVMLGIAAARPQHITVVDQSQRGRNIALVLDVSRSMSAIDFPAGLVYTSRMEGVKSVVAEYVRNRSQDRIGLIVFGNTSYLQSPLTTDTHLIEELVNGLRPGMAGDGTAIGDGLGLALKRLRDIEGGSKAIILLTDGVNNAGQVSPLKAAKVARDLGIKIHAIGIGSGDATTADRVFGNVMGLSVAGRAEIDEKTLREIASTTGGVYFNASSLDGLKEVYREIERLSETEENAPAKTIVQELFVPFVTMGLLCYLVATLFNVTFFLKVP